MAKARSADVKRANAAAKTIVNLASFVIDLDRDMQQEWKSAKDDLVAAFKVPEIYAVFKVAARKCQWDQPVSVVDSLRECDFSSTSAHHLAMILGLVWAKISGPDVEKLYAYLEHECDVALELLKPPTEAPSDSPISTQSRYRVAAAAFLAEQSRTPNLNPTPFCKTYNKRLKNPKDWIDPHALRAEVSRLRREKRTSSRALSKFRK